MLGRSCPLVVAAWAALAPALALAQPASDNGAPTPAGFAWLWIIAAIAVLAALFAMFFGGRRPRGRPTPPARTP
jgi:CDP-diglyceride synthetase